MESASTNVRKSSRNVRVAGLSGSRRRGSFAGASSDRAKSSAIRDAVTRRCARSARPSERGGSGASRRTFARAPPVAKRARRTRSHAIAKRRNARANRGDRSFVGRCSTCSVSAIKSGNAPSAMPSMRRRLLPIGVSPPRRPRLATATPRACSIASRTTRLSFTIAIQRASPAGTPSRSALAAASETAPRSM